MLHARARATPPARSAPAACACRKPRRARLAAAAGGSAAAAADLGRLQAQLASTITRLNSADEDAEALRELRQLTSLLSAANPTPRPAESPLINGRWALLYTLPDKAKGDVQRDALNQALAAAYNLFYERIPIIAGSAVGRKKGKRARGQFQTFDTAAGWVSNQARFEALGSSGQLDVNGPAQVAASAAGERITATFTEAELRWGSLRLPFPIGMFSPSGYIDTLYLDDEWRISKGDKGSLFYARRVKEGNSSDA